MSRTSVLLRRFSHIKTALERHLIRLTLPFYIRVDRNGVVPADQEAEARMQELHAPIKEYIVTAGEWDPSDEGIDDRPALSMPVPEEVEFVEWPEGLPGSSQDPGID